MLNYISDTLSVAKVYYNKSMSSSLEIVKNGIKRLDSPYKKGCSQILEDNLSLFLTAAGSSHNHQHWQGGYLDHIAEIFQIAEGIYNIFPERKSLIYFPDVLLVLYLHDIEKPFLFNYDENGNFIILNEELNNKPAREAFRTELIKKYKLPLKEKHWHALKHVEGIRDKYYTSGDRVMSELGALCHLADMASARLWHDCPKNS